MKKTTLAALLSAAAMTVAGAVWAVETQPAPAPAAEAAAEQPAPMVGMSDAIAVAERAAQMGVKIFTIGIGTPEGAPIQIGGEFIKDEAGEMVVSKLNEEMLARIADITGGAYVRSSKQSIGLDEIVKAINEMEQTELSTVRFEEFNEQYQYLLIAALVLLLLEFVVLDRRNPLLAHLNIFREK